MRTCDQIQGVNAIDFADRGYNASIGAFGGKPLAESRCESCGECVVRCPVGALAPKNAVAVAKCNHDRFPPGPVASRFAPRPDRPVVRFLSSRRANDGWVPNGFR